jgi:hypothetical protein
MCVIVLRARSSSSRRPYLSDHLAHAIAVRGPFFREINERILYMSKARIATCDQSPSSTGVSDERCVFWKLTLSIGSLVDSTWYKTQR